jgi:hypothetical protein
MGEWYLSTLSPGPSLHSQRWDRLCLSRVASRRPGLHREGQRWSEACLCLFQGGARKALSGQSCSRSSRVLRRSVEIATQSGHSLPDMLDLDQGTQ